jgi:hypothetical protein
MITFEEVKNLRRGDMLVDNCGKRWKVNGMVKTWKRNPEKVYVPLKHGLYKYGSVHQENLNLFSKEGK